MVGMCLAAAPHLLHLWGSPDPSQSQPQAAPLIFLVP